MFYAFKTTWGDYTNYHVTGTSFFDFWWSWILPEICSAILCVTASSMVFIETPLDAAHEAKAFWVKPPEALMLASLKVSVGQVAIVPFVTALVLSHSTEAHHIPAMASDEPTPRDNHHSSEEEEAPSPGSPTNSWQGDPSSCAEHKACRDNKQSHKEEVENKENQTKRKAKTKRAETLKEGWPTPVLSVSHGSTVIDCSDGSMITIYREHEGRFVQTGWAPPSKEKPVVLANSKNLALGHLWKVQISGTFRTRIPQVALSIVRYLSTLRTSITWRVSYTLTVMLKTGTGTLGRSMRNCGFATLPLRG